jgi:hypothetical protein
MVSTQIGKRLSLRNSQRCFGVVPLIPAVILPVDADGESVLKRAAITRTLSSAFYDKFRRRILSSGAWNFSACLTTGFMFLLYNGLSFIFKVTNGFLSNQIRYTLDYDWILQSFR